MIVPVFPLFKDKDYDEALQYLTSKMLSGGQIMSVEIDLHTKESLEDQSAINDFIYALTANSVKYLFGVNVPQMANYMQVQDFVLDKVKPALLNYMTYTKLDGLTFEYAPTSFTTPALIKEAKSGRPALYVWDTDEMWDLEKEIDSKDKLLTCPLNGYINLFLQLNDVDNVEFKQQLHTDGVIDREDLIKSTLVIKLLPCNNFNKALNLMHALFRYY